MSTEEKRDEMILEIETFIKKFVKKYQPKSPTCIEELKLSLYVSVVDHKENDVFEASIGNMDIIIKAVMLNDDLRPFLIKNIIEDATR